MPASIDVVIPVYGNYPLTHSCLTHLAAQTAPHRVIVVDDGSLDDTARRLALEWPAVTLIEQGSNQGYTRAVNRGAREGSGEYIVLLNNDVQLRADFLQRLTEPLAKDDRLGSVASVMLAPGEELIDSVGVVVDRTLAGFARLQGLPASAAANDTASLTGPEGTAGAYRRRAWEQVGGLDEQILAYMEIVDLALKLQGAGWRTTAATDAVGVHLGSHTYGRRSPAQRRLAGFSRGYLLRRWGVLRSAAAPRALLTELLVVAGDLVLTHDLQALVGRIEGWRSAAGLPHHAPAPPGALDRSISFSRSLALRRGAVAR